MSEFSGQVTHLELSATPLWWIPLLPFLGAVINAVFGRRLQASTAGRDLSKRLHIGSFGVSAVAVGAMLVAFGLVVFNFVRLLGLEPGHRYLYSHAWQMVRVGSLDVNFSFAMDPLSALMTLIITGVGSLIHVYACSYMETEPAYWRFFTYLNLFVFSMLLLVLGDNFIVMFFGWEGVGLCSYLLIGFWYKDYKKASAGMKAFVVNRVGDWGVICGMSLLFWGLGGAWVEHGRYHPDYRARFVAVQAEPYAEEEPEDHVDHVREVERGEQHGDRVEHGEKGAQGAHGEPGARADHRPDPPAGAESPRKREVAPRRPVRIVGTKGLLTMTAYPGAKVYLGVSDAMTLNSSRAPEPFATSPFIRKELPPGVQNIAIVAGGGAVVVGDGVEVALLDHVSVERGEEMLIAVVGPTLTFREIHDQLVMKDGSGKAFLKAALERKAVWGGVSLITLACLLLFVGATGKSAQIPLYVWLPDAMAGPTPVSALIHAATMVTAGVYMIARLNYLFSLSATACGVVAFIGASTALFAATIGFFQYDIKKVLAYSTVSQLGFMFIGVGVGAYSAGVFHLMTHAFFKACLFLGSGSVIHGMHAVEHDEVAVQDMRNMGGLKRVMPTTAATYFIACLAITAAPFPFFAGFWSKDEILWKAFTTENTGALPGVLVYGMGLVAALGTSFYMWRSYYLTFDGPHARKDIASKVRESPLTITGVLMLLAVLSSVSGFIFGFSKHLLGDRHAEPLLEQWLAPVLSLGHAQTHFTEQSLGLELGLMALSVAGAIGCWALARSRYGAGRSPNWAAEERTLPGFTLLQNKYYVDELYQGSIVKWFMALRLVFADMDTWIVDGLVNGLAVLVRLVSWINGAIDHYLVDGIVNFVATGTLAAGAKLRSVQTGRIQNYVYGLLGGVAFFALVQYFLR
jgi:NADH-quinone oxidoreductase subunit L